MVTPEDGKAGTTVWRNTATISRVIPIIGPALLPHPITIAGNNDILEIAIVPDTLFEVGIAVGGLKCASPGLANGHHQGEVPVTGLAVVDFQVQCGGCAGVDSGVAEVDRADIFL
jgi:hypothetical protein